MRKNNTIFILFFILFLSVATVNVNAQLNDYSYKLGLQVHYVMPANEFENDGVSMLFRPFARFELSHIFDLGVGAGYGWMQGVDYSGSNTYMTKMVPIDARLILSPFVMETWNPYLYAGIGGVSWWISDPPKYPSRPVDYTGFTGFVPVGGGVEIALSKNWILDVAGGWNRTFSDDLNGYASNVNYDHDRWWNVGIGAAYVKTSCEIDPDEDGLTNCEEDKIGTDPENPDTDGDDLKDGEEVMNYNSDPLKADSDGDGLKDGEEVKSYQTDPLKADTDSDGLNDFAEVVTYKTDPLNADTDGDTLKDGEEVNKYKTDPNKPDTDMDGLNDGMEVNKTKTDPLNADTDGEGLKDGEEVTKYNTNPLEVDTDKGSIDDFVEVTRRTNPLDPADDIIIERVTIYDVNFGFDSSTLSAENQKKLDDLIEKLKIRSSVKVKVEGYTDSVGPAAYNLKLSKRRAEVVKQYLVDKGIKADRISTDGAGKKNPIDSNKTKEGRAKNRRVEISKAE